MIAELPGDAGATHVTPNVPAERVEIARLRGCPGGVDDTADGVTELDGGDTWLKDPPAIATAWNEYETPLARPEITHERDTAGFVTVQKTGGLLPTMPTL